MKVRMLANVPDGSRVLKDGETYDLDETRAVELLNVGHACVDVEPKKIEAAAVEPETKTTKVTKRKAKKVSTRG